jgi:para-aminobenzoate synthetase component 2
MHGKTSRVHHTGSDLFAGIPNVFTATRYHSLAVVRDTLSDELQVTAETDGGAVMALAHRELPIYGVQYHPESVLTEFGYRQLGNWLELIGIANAADRAAALSPLIRDGHTDNR